MHTCETCQTLMLEYLYDLLDESERQPLQDHLAGCAALPGGLAASPAAAAAPGRRRAERVPGGGIPAPGRAAYSGSQPAPAAPAVLPMPAGRAALRPAATDRRWRRGPWRPPCFWASGSPFRASGWGEIISRPAARPVPGRP